MTRLTRKIGPVAILSAAILAALAWVIFPAVAQASPLYPTGTTGFDVSWPNCSASAPSKPHFGIVGVNDGTGYSQNPCLAHEAAWFPSLKATCEKQGQAWIVQRLGGCVRIRPI